MISASSFEFPIIRELHSLLSRQKFPVRIRPKTTNICQNAHKHWRESRGNPVWVEKFPVFFPVNGNLGAESGSHWTASTAIKHLPIRNG